MQKKSIQEIIHKYQDDWLSIPGVEGIGEGEWDEKPCIVIFASIAADELRKHIPEYIENCFIIIKDTGTFNASL